jgi:hypothetical protein
MKNAVKKFFEEYSVKSIQNYFGLDDMFEVEFENKKIVVWVDAFNDIYLVDTQTDEIINDEEVLYKKLQCLH